MAHVTRECRNRMKRKIDVLLRRNNQTYDDRWVVNLSSRTLSSAEKSILSKGLNFALAPRRIPIPRIVAAVESGLKEVGEDEAAVARRRVIGLLGKARPPPSNVSPSESRALSNLRKDTSILVLPADKGRATVVLNRQDYEQRMEDMLSDRSTYQVLRKDPTPCLQRQMNSSLLKLKTDGELSNVTYNRLRCSSGSIPRIYGLPKIHKQNTPLRPIVSSYSSPTYQLSKHLVTILSPLLGATSSTVRNSKDFVSFVRSINLDEEVLVSCDVVSLFTKVPVDLALQIAHARLLDDDTLDTRSGLSVAAIKSLLSLCLNATYFSYQGVFYKQVYGTAMGSPVSVVVANLVMEDIESRALSSFSPSPVFWKRYVDDVCCAVKEEDVIPFLQHINSIHPSIQFTHELEDDDHCLPFLDVLLYRSEDGSVSTSVYRKPTHTDRYLDFASHHPLLHKAAVVKTLFSRADTISSCALKLHEEHAHIVRALHLNNYPDQFVSRVRSRSSSRPTDDSHTKKRVVIPYVRGLSEAIQRVLLDVGVRVMFRPHMTLRQQLVHPKDPVPSSMKSGVVYSIPCTTCPAVYVGQTSRSLETRLKEHKAAVRHAKTEVSAVAEHVWKENHQMDFQQASILAQEPDTCQRCLLESWFIQTEKHTINREVGSLAPDYRSVF